MSYQVTAEKVHAIIQTWDRCMRESGVSCSYYPSDRKVMDWIEQYSSALVEEAIEEGIPRFLRKVKAQTGRPLSRSMAEYAINYCGGVLRNMAEKIQHGESQVVEREGVVQKTEGGPNQVAGEDQRVQ